MQLNRKGETFQYNGITYTVGGRIIGTNKSEYEGLRGYILEILDGDDKETENETPDIYCEFDVPEDPEEIARVEEIFSDLYDEPKTIDDICFDSVVMAPSMIRPLYKYCTTITRHGWIYVEATSTEEAADIADHQTTDTVDWSDDWSVTAVDEDASSFDSNYVYKRAFD